MEWIGLIIFGAVVSVGITFYAQAHQRKKTLGVCEELTKEKGFTVSKKIFSINGKKGVAYDKNTQEICLITTSKKKNYFKIVKYKDILSCEIFVDGGSVSRTSRTSQLGGALVGGILLGGVGAVVGSLTGKKISSGTVERVDLRIVVNDIDNPLHEINLLDHETKKSGQAHKMVDDEAREWKAVFDILIRKADMDDEQAA